MGSKIKYPVCAQCGHTLNPHMEDDCEKYYIVGKEIYCKYCFEDYMKEFLEDNMDEIAEAIGIPVVRVEAG